MPPPTTTSAVAVTITLAAKRTEGRARRNLDIRRSIRFGRRGVLIVSPSMSSPGGLGQAGCT
jgi:hypothetical protein